MIIGLAHPRRGLSMFFAENNIITRRPPVRPPNGTRPGSAPHPSRGGSSGYSQDLRDQVITLWMNGDDLMDPWIEQLRFQRKFPCYRTCRRWISSILTIAILVARGQLAIDSQSARFIVKTSLILLCIGQFDLRPTLMKFVPTCTTGTPTIHLTLGDGNRRGAGTSILLGSSTSHRRGKHLSPFLTHSPCS